MDQQALGGRDLSRVGEISRTLNHPLHNHAYITGLYNDEPTGLAKKNCAKFFLQYLW